MSGSFFRRSCAALAGLALCGGITLAGLAATGGTASANTVPYATSQLVFSSSGLLLDVSGASLTPGAPVIQWYPNGQSNQAWNIPEGETPGPVSNVNSGQCLSTDGVAGDQLYQWPCDPGSINQQWSLIYPYGPDYADLYNPYFDLVVDVSGDSYAAGASIDAWPWNGQASQLFFLP